MNYNRKMKCTDQNFVFRKRRPRTEKFAADVNFKSPTAPVQQNDRQVLNYV